MICSTGRPRVTRLAWASGSLTGVSAPRSRTGDLRARALGVAGRLAEACAPGDRAMLVLETGPEFIAAVFGCLYAGVIAVPAAAGLNSRETLERGTGIVENCRPAAVISAPSRQKLVDAMLARAGGQSVVRLDATQIADGEHDAGIRRELAILQQHVALTARPRGVRLTHDNIVHNASALSLAFRVDRDAVGVGWLPLSHDMGLIGNTIVPMHFWPSHDADAPTSTPAPPGGVAACGVDYRATVSGGPNFAFDLCVDRIAPAEAADLDLSAWTVAYNGGEPVRPATLRRFTLRFGQNGFRPRSFRPCYGLAEAVNDRSRAVKPSEGRRHSRWIGSG